MKRLAMAFACFALVSMAVQAQLAQITLMHGDQATMYNSDKTADALAAAQDGDVLYFSEGSYVGGVTITKKVSLVGAGLGTVINGNITIGLESSQAAMPAHMLDALNINGNVITKGTIAVDGLNIRKCVFTDFEYPNNITCKLTNFVIDRCFILGTLPLTPFLTEGLTVLNSKINNIRGNAVSASAATFLNCNIKCIYNSSSNKSYELLATLINSIIFNSYGFPSNKDCVFINCLYGIGAQSVVEKGVCTNCWCNQSLEMNNQLECTYPTEEDLQAMGYLGTDGTVVGVTGGTAPFTLVPSTPRITESVIKVDPETRKLNVNLKVTAN